uniref:Peptidase S9 prolyl oligopeptidase catalytic domain-containing protein n=1 Tax=viral metagenome TaxID=1070528 RepID=A0A6C0I179_9ZZZZ
MNNFDYYKTITKTEIKKFKNEKFNSIFDLYSIIYKSDGLLVHGYILQKKDLKKPRPVVIYCRGGNRSFGENSPKTISSNKELLDIASNEIAIIFYPNYRGSSFSEGVDEFGGNDVNDIINLYPIIQKICKIKNPKIVLYGWSRGGLMAMLVASKVNWVKSIIIGGALYNFSRNMKERPEMKEMFIKEFKFKKKDFMQRSPKYFMDKIPKNTPILILHGSADTRVSVYDAYEYGQHCQKLNIPYKLIIFPNGNHGLNEYIDDVSREVIQWINTAFK